VDLGHIYGETLERQHKLRLFKDGKLKYQVCAIQIDIETELKEIVHPNKKIHHLLTLKFFHFHFQISPFFSHIIQRGHFEEPFLSIQ